jgi:hypothetical protein
LLPKSELKQAYVYRAEKQGMVAFEFLSITGRSNVVALPEEIEPAGLVARLREIGYPVESAL